MWHKPHQDGENLVGTSMSDVVNHHHYPNLDIWYIDEKIELKKKKMEQKIIYEIWDCVSKDKSDLGLACR